MQSVLKDMQCGLNTQRLACGFLRFFLVLFKKPRKDAHNFTAI